MKFVILISFLRIIDSFFILIGKKFLVGVKKANCKKNIFGFNDGLKKNHFLRTNKSQFQLTSNNKINRNRV
jgi:hypothetical protein